MARIVGGSGAGSAPAGLELLAVLDQPVDRWDRRALGMLSRTEVNQLVRLVNTILADGA